MLYRIFYQTKDVAETIEVVAKNPDMAIEMLKGYIKGIVEYEFENRALIVFNDGNLALLCSECHRILKVGKDFSPLETDYALGKLKYLSPLKCDHSCKDLDKSLA